MAAKGIVKGIITAAVICGLGAGGYGLYKHFGGTVSTSSDKVFVQKVATLNTVDGANLFAHNFSGVIVAQKTVDVKYDPEKTIGEILVENGDTVKKGDKLMTYDVEKIQVDIDSAKLEIERLKTEIETFKSEIEQYEQEKKTAVGDAAITCTTNILSKKSSIAKNEYDIKTKEADVTKLEKTLENAFVTAPIDGTVKDIKDSGSTQNPMDMYGYNNQPQSNDVLLKIAAAGNYRVKGVFNEQNSAQIHPGAKVLLRSRIDDSLVLHGEVSEIDSSPETNNQSDYYMPMDEQSTSAKYAFYVEP
ncbi:MAG: efflux RND transporter periplasmic adaptor subunit, partial [Oscillospiraceae bacterium]|nr:efflux RND transporter periplasmic adaptor subunit [Oscillospiraceae bacterium]